MYFWNAYPYVRLTIALIIGILTADYLSDIFNNRYILWAGIGFFVISTRLANAYGFYSLRHLNGLIALILITLFGSIVTLEKYHQHASDHYIHFNQKIRAYAGTIISSEDERTNHTRFKFRVNQVMLEDSVYVVSGIIHLYVKKDTFNNADLRYGDQLLVSSGFYHIPPPGNPNEFDYKLYLSHQRIYSHSFVGRNFIKKIGNSPPNIFLEKAFQIRSYTSNIIDHYIIHEKERAVIKALLIGTKDELDNDLKKSYSAAGAMHVLAVSGLHVGIVFMFMKFLLGFIKKTRNGQVLFSILCVGVIWSYALITGLSPSVQRAATMFSIIALGEIGSRAGNIYNSLGIAAFTLLVFEPYILYAVGFQLSFAAVFGIVYLQPKIYNLFQFRFKLLDQAWAITCVSIAAQVATFPLTAYYFHQFPTYFLVSNLVVIPAASVMLILGILMLVIDPISGSIAGFIASLLSYVVTIVNGSVSIVESLPNSLIEWIHLDLLSMILIYFFSISTLWGLQKKSFKTLLFSFLILLFGLTRLLQNYLHYSEERKLVFYEVKGKTAIDYIRGHRATLFLDTIYASEEELLAYQFDPNRMANQLRSISESTTTFTQSDQFQKMECFTVGLLDHQKILIIDSPTFHLQFNEVINTDILLIENESVKSLNWLISHFNFKHLIVGNKNSSFFNEKMKNQASALGINLHVIKEDGAFIHDLN